MKQWLVRLKVLVCLVSLSAFFLALRAEGQKTQTNPAPASQTTYSPFDVIAQKLTSDTFDSAALTSCDETDANHKPVAFADAVKSFVKTAQVADARCIIERAAKAHSGSPESTDVLQNGNAVILHVMTWKRTVVKATDPTFKGNTMQYQPVQGAWGVYRIKKGTKTTFEQQLDLSGPPYLFRAKHIYVMDVNSGEVICGADQNNQLVCKPPVDVAYDIETTARQKQNQSDLATLVSTLLKTSTGTTQNAAGLAAPAPIVWGTVGTVTPTVPVPYDVAVTATYSASQDPANQSTTIAVQLACNVVPPKTQDATGNQNPNGGANPSDSPSATPGSGGPSDPGLFDSSNESSSQSAPPPSTTKPKPQGSQTNQTACSISRTVTHYDPEYWDVSVGMAIPGPIETTYKSSTSSSTTGSSSGSTTVTPSKVTHTDAYAFFDLYLFEGGSSSPANLSWYPHINAGIPITGQTLHRPYVGLAENLGFLTKHVKLNIPLSVFAGPVFMKQQVELPGTTTLKWDRATKMIYGVELPISSITNFLKSSGGSKNSSTSKNSTSGGTSSQ